MAIPEILKNNIFCRFSIYILFLIAGIFFILMSFQSVCQYYAVNPQSWDISIYTQNMYLLVNGFSFNTARGINLWGHHLEPVLFPIAHLVKFSGRPELMFVIQIFVICFGVFFVFYFSAKLTENSKTAFIISILYLLYPALHNSALFEFHPGSLAIPFFFPLIYFLKKNRQIYAFLILFLIFSTRENYALATACLCLYYFNENSTAKYSFFISIIYFAVSILVIKPYFNNGAGDLHMIYYSEFGKTPGQILLNIFFNYELTLSKLFSVNSFKYLVSLYLPLLFFPLIKPKMNLIIIPMLLINLLSSHPASSTINFHFQNEIIPLLFIITIEGASELSDKISKRFSYIILMVFLLIIPVSIYYSKLYIFDKTSKYMMKYNDKMVFLKNIKPLIKPDFSVCADVTFAPYFSYRKNIYIFPDCPENVDVIIINKKQLFGQLADFFNYQIKARNIGHNIWINDYVCIFVKK